ncbi:unnamed protein product [Periconia digitata]|uniref:Wax synthase domain-containing protein n=1 Tax=Periconia digitata TaxID=1303443 RepID=A0A9W4UI67_9PLEO|nr:unnamed protein product [Periconia digitata]
MLNENSNQTLVGIVRTMSSASQAYALIPLAAALLSAAIFTAAIQLSYQARILAVPFMISAAILSICTNSYLEPIPHGPETLSQLICFWVHHALVTLLIEPVFIPTNLPREQRRRFIRKIWNDPRRLTTLEACEKTKGSMTRTRFLMGAIQRLGLYLVLHRFFAVINVLVGPDQLTADDFSPQRRALLRRVLTLNPVTPVTLRELHIRAWMSVEWIWFSYLKLNTYNVVASIIFVAILRFDSPEEWPPLFGSPLEAYSIQRFWGKFWHPLLRHPCAASGRLISRKVFRFHPRSRYEKTWLAFWTFFISGVNHAIAARAIGCGGTLADSIRFRMSNFAAGAMETIIGPVLEQVILVHQDRAFGRVLVSRSARKIFGYTWVFAVFFWIKPQERYAKLYANLE